MHRRALFPLAALALGLVPDPAAAEARKPNIVVIVADDLGYADLGCQGCKDVPTPNIDSIAKNGVRFTDGYVSCPVCSPTRAGLMTGRYQQRFGHEFNGGPDQNAPENFGLPLTETPLPQRLRKGGYATGMVGKWHLGYKAELMPTKRGFDEFFGFLGGAHSYVNSNADPNNRILRGDKPVDEAEYLTDAFGREAVAFIDRHKGEPFFLYLPFNAVHAPMQGAKKYHDRFADIKDDKRRTFAAMLSAMDDNVGRVLAKLREEKLEENTLIVFFSDNGGPTAVTSSRNDPLRGHKGQVWDGGIRIPFLAQWKGKLPAGKVYSRPVIALDIAPTALAAAGLPTPDDARFDGVNLLPYLKGEKDGPPHDRLFWRYGAQSAVRKGDWKLVKINGGTHLFNLADDVGEMKDLAKDKPELLKELEADLKAWDAQLMKPLWQAPRQQED
jgi:arylsulfatase A-like enzyme